MRPWPPAASIRPAWLTTVLVAIAVLAGPIAASAGTTRAVVANSGDPGSVTIVDLEDGSAQTLGDPSFIEPRGVAITPNGKFAAVTNFGSNTVTWIDLVAGTVLGATVVGDDPRGIALTAARAIVALGGPDDAVKIIDISGLPDLPGSPVAPDGPPLENGDNPEAVRITLDGRFAAVALNGANLVRYIDLDAAPAAFLPGGTAVDDGPFDIAFVPESGQALVTMSRGASLAVVDVRGLPVVPAGPVTTVAVGNGPRGLAVSPDGAVAMVATRERAGRVALVDLATQGVTELNVAGNPFGAAATSTADGPVGVVTRETHDPGRMRIIDLATGATVLDVDVGDEPQGVAITPVKIPKAKLVATPVRGPLPLDVTLDASKSRDPDGTLLRFTYSFGDGTPPVTKVCASDPTCKTAAHTYTTLGRHRARVQVMDDDGVTAQAHRVVAVVPNEPPDVEIGSNTRVGPAPLTVRFEARAADRDGTVVAFCWNFGEGVPGCNATGPRPRHTFVEAKRYKVTLTVTDNLGAIATADRRIHAREE
jgi:DNA-binding beta-propeller fold protein YncE